MSANEDDLLRLPAGLRLSSDPVEGNPFPALDPRHQVWDDATREAEQQWCLLNSQTETPSDRPADAFIVSVCDRTAGKFDIWAKRGVHVVWSDGDLRSYDRWLISYAEAWLQEFSSKDPYSRLVPIRDLLSGLRLVLTKRVSWWKADARRYLAEQRAHAQKGTSATSTPKRRASRPKPPCFESAVELLKKDQYRNLTLIGFCQLMDCKADQYPSTVKYRPPASWKVRSFLEQYRKRANTVSRFLHNVRKSVVV